MDTLHALYRISPENLATRREFIDLRERDVVALRKLHGWAKNAVPKIVTAFYDHQFAFPATAEFLGRFAEQHGRNTDEFRAGLETTQQGYLMAIFDEAAGDGRIRSRLL